jgi:hypothetical protein
VGGPFGSGKSHLMHCFRAEALAAGFAVSPVTVGPEFPLHNLAVAVRVLANASEAPRAVGKATRELAAAAPGDPAKFEEFGRWAEASGIDSRFVALIELYKVSPFDEELRLRIVDDLEGKPLLNTELRSRLKGISTGRNWVLESAGGARLAPQRLRLLPRFFHACGLNGWVVLIDELEVLGRFGLRQRLAAYRSMGEIVRAATTEGSCLVPVFASTDGSYLEFISDDEANVLAGLYYPDDASREDAILGLSAFRNVLALEKPDRDQIGDIQYRIQTIYEAAYQTRVSDPHVDSELLGYQIRTQIRNWVTQWDLNRFYPAEHVSVESAELSLDTRALGEGVEIEESDLNE